MKRFFHFLLEPKLNLVGEKRRCTNGGASIARIRHRKKQRSEQLNGLAREKMHTDLTSQPKLRRLSVLEGIRDYYYFYYYLVPIFLRLPYIVLAKTR